MKEYDKVFNSREYGCSESFQLATGYISTTTILFEKENIVARIEAKGHIAFLDCKDTLLAVVDIPEQTGGREVYNDVVCQVEENVITLKFPIVTWIDNYPNCDGESDRWDTKTIGYHTLNFDVQTKEITLS